jgi:S-formylglutathione hydrolase FrmB
VAGVATGDRLAWQPAPGDDVRDLEQALPTRPAAGGYADGRHNFGYWSTIIPAAFDFVARALARP